MSSLYELAGEYRAISEKLDDTELDEQTIADTLESLSGDFEEKAINVAKFIRNVEAEAKAIKEEEERMAKRRMAKEHLAERTRDYLLANMLVTGIGKVDSPWFVLSVRQNPESVNVEDESLLPPDYKREIPAKYEPDKNLIKQALKDGYAVPGCHLSRSTSLSIR